MDHRLAALFVLAVSIGCGGSSGDAGATAPDATQPPADAPAIGDGTGGANAADGGASSPVCPPLPAAPSAGPADPHPLYPEPRFSEIGALEAPAASVCVETSILPAHARLDALLPELARSVGMKLVPFDCGCDYRIRFETKAPPLAGEAAHTWALAGENPERYVVASSSEGGRAKASLVAASERGALYAVRAALSLAQKPAGASAARIATATIVDYPTIGRRGVVEGIYNPDTCSMLALPWRVGERRAAIDLVSELRGNGYLYSPKCDPYARDQWQTPYPPGSSDEQVIRVALHEAERRMLDFIWAVSPGVNGLAAVSPATLKAKIDSMRALGVQHFGLFLDDIDDHAAGPQIALVNAIDDYIRSTAPDERLLVVGTTYCGHSGNQYNCEGPNAYTDQLGAEVHPTVDLVWTGEDVIPATMTASDMTAINASYRRKVTIWDNWPNVSTGFTGRGNDLGGAVSGYFSNPLLSEQSHPIGDYFAVMGPIFDYLWATERYGAASSYAAWQPRLAANGGPLACAPCGSVSTGWTCDAADPHAILFCDPQTACLGSHPCPGGCVVGATGVEDVCK